ncbi:hypothetical protein DCBHLPFO_00736 [Mycoplasmopsis arginini]|uniref:Uncharacterized protein n=1 Tax=Mycoplasmopsis arginini TaxID=2094 RepID=A0AA43TWA5_MYCAR|nr:hypothetical protein [Mycoplasmopsis arginini]
MIRLSTSTNFLFCALNNRFSKCSIPLICLISWAFSAPIKDWSVCSEILWSSLNCFFNCSLICDKSNSISDSIFVFWLTKSFCLLNKSAQESCNASAFLICFSVAKSTEFRTNKIGKFTSAALKKDCNSSQ